MTGSLFVAYYYVLPHGWKLVGTDLDSLEIAEAAAKHELVGFKRVDEGQRGYEYLYLAEPLPRNQVGWAADKMRASATRWQK